MSAKLNAYQRRLVSAAIPKNIATMGPAEILAIAQIVVGILKMFGVSIPDIIEILKDRKLPVPPELEV